MKLADTFADPQVQKIGIAAQNNVFSKDVAKGVRRLAEQYGWDIAVDQTFPEGTDDLSCIINKLKNENPEVFVLATYFNHSVLLAKQLCQYNVSPPMTVSTVGAATSDFIEEAGAAGNYIYGTSQWASNGEYGGFFYGSAPDYVKGFTSAYDYQPDYHNAAGSAAVLVYLNGFKQMDSLNPKQAQKFITETDVKTFFGDIDFESNGANDKTTVGYQWQDNERKLVAPPNIATDEAIYPAPAWGER